MERSLGVLDVVTAETISKFKLQDHAGLDTALSALDGHIVESFIEWSRRMMLQRCAMELQSEAGAAEGSLPTASIVGGNALRVGHTVAQELRRRQQHHLRVLRVLREVHRLARIVCDVIQQRRQIFGSEVHEVESHAVVVEAVENGQPALGEPGPSSV